MTSTERDPSLPPASEASEPVPPFRGSGPLSRLNASAGLQLALGLCFTLLGMALGWVPLTLVAGTLTLLLSLLQLLPPLLRRLAGRLDDVPTTRVLAGAGVLVAVVALPLALG
ncbi:MAG: pentapeptide repeat-containing protein, partial [Cyanobium sp.]